MLNGPMEYIPPIQIGDMHTRYTYTRYIIDMEIRGGGGVRGNSE